MPTELPLDALEMAVWIRAGHDLTGLVHRSDAGSQYTSFRYTDRLAQLGVLASIGTVGDSFDNALAESTIGLYKSEVIHHQGPWRGANDVELATAIWVHWFNTERLHGSIGRIPPVEFENNGCATQQTPTDPSVTGDGQVAARPPRARRVTMNVTMNVTMHPPLGKQPCNVAAPAARRCSAPRGARPTARPHAGRRPTATAARPATSTGSAPRQRAVADAT
jgi:hypothetical protein